MGPKIPLGQKKAESGTYVTAYREGYFDQWQCLLCGSVVDSAQAVAHVNECAVAYLKESQCDEDTQEDAQMDVEKAKADAAARQRDYEQIKKAHNELTMR